MELNQLFEQASIKAKELPSQSNDNLLKLYSLFKQATDGDVNVEKPSNMFDFVGMAKYNAWADLKGITKDQAKQQYIDLVNSLAGK
jgi:diazepam-binding inhibitor (GABA receptor modulating acyl-CoA-binding protein)